MDKLRVKILEDRKAGLTYEQIQRKRGVSSRTIAKLVKGKDLKRFCKMCGETDPEKLEEHHPDKENFPNYTVTLCASCHAKVTRKQMREKAKKEEKRTYGLEKCSRFKSFLSGSEDNKQASGISYPHKTSHPRGEERFSKSSTLLSWQRCNRKGPF